MKLYTVRETIVWEIVAINERDALTHVENSMATYKYTARKIIKRRNIKRL